MNKKVSRAQWQTHATTQLQVTHHALFTLSGDKDVLPPPRNHVGFFSRSCSPAILRQAGLCLDRQFCLQAALQGWD